MSKQNWVIWPGRVLFQECSLVRRWSKYTGISSLTLVKQTSNASAVTTIQLNWIKAENCENYSSRTRWQVTAHKHKHVDCLYATRIHPLSQLRNSLLNIAITIPVTNGCCIRSTAALFAYVSYLITGQLEHGSPFTSKFIGLSLGFTFYYMPSNAGIGWTFLLACSKSTSTLSLLITSCRGVRAYSLSHRLLNRIPCVGKL